MSMQIPSKRNILFFQGIFVSHSNKKDIFTKSNYSLTNKTNNVEKKWDKIPPEFRSKENWINSINLKCPTCSLAIEEVPVPLPAYIVNDPLTKEIIFKGIKSVHCSWTCASMYNTVFHDNDETSYFALKELFRIWNDYEYLIDIPIGVPHILMEEYGGNINVKQWKLANDSILREALSRFEYYNSNPNIMKI